MTVWQMACQTVTNSAHEGNKAVGDGHWKLLQKWRGMWELYGMQAPYDPLQFGSICQLGHVSP